MIATGKVVRVSWFALQLFGSRSHGSSLAMTSLRPGIVLQPFSIYQAAITSRANSKNPTKSMPINAMYPIQLGKFGNSPTLISRLTN